MAAQDCQRKSTRCAAVCALDMEWDDDNTNAAQPLLRPHNSTKRSNSCPRSPQRHEPLLWMSPQHRLTSGAGPIATGPHRSGSTSQRACGTETEKPLLEPLQAAQHRTSTMTNLSSALADTLPLHYHYSAEQAEKSAPRNSLICATHGPARYIVLTTE